MKVRRWDSLRGRTWSSCLAATHASWRHNLQKPLVGNTIRLKLGVFPTPRVTFRIPSEVIDAVRKEPVVLVSNTFPDSGIVETLLMLEAINDVRKGNLANLREIGPQQLEDVGPGTLLAVPYFGYSRQDKRFKPGEAISAQGPLATSSPLRCDGIIVFDLHAPKGASRPYPFPVAFTSAMPELAKHLQETVKP